MRKIKKSNGSRYDLYLGKDLEFMEFTAPNYDTYAPDGAYVKTVDKKVYWIGLMSTSSGNICNIITKKEIETRLNNNWNICSC